MLQLLMCAFGTAIVLLLHTAVHNYQDVNLSFLHETKTSTMNIDKRGTDLTVWLSGTLYFRHVAGCRTTTLLKAD